MPGGSQSLRGPQRFPPWKLTPPFHTRTARGQLSSRMDTARQEPPRIKSGRGPPAPSALHPTPVGVLLPSRRPPSPSRLGGATGTGPPRPPRADFILGRQRNQNGEKTKGKSYSDPSPTPRPRARSEEQPRNRSEGPKEEGKSLNSRAGLFRASAGRGDGGASKQNRAGAFAVRGRNVLYKFKKHRHVSGRSLSALCPAIPLVHPSARGGAEKKEKKKNHPLG